MNKKSLAMAMAAVTVVGSAAPVFAQVGDKVDVAGQGYTVASSKYKTVIKDLKQAVKDGAVVTATYKKMDKDNSNKAEIVQENVPFGSATTDAGKDAQYDAVEKKLSDLGTGEFVDFNVHFAGKTTTGEGYKTYTNSEIDALASSFSTDLGAITNNQLIAANIGFGATPVAALTADDNANTKFAGYFGAVTSAYDSDNSTKKIEVTAKAVSAAADKLFTDLAGTHEIVVEPFTIKAGDKKLDLTSPIVDVNTGKITGFNLAPKGSISTTTEDKDYTVRVINAEDKTITVGSDSSDQAKDLAKKYVFDDTILENLYKTGIDALSQVDGNYSIVLYPKAKRLQGFSTYGASSDYTEGSLANGNAPIRLTVKSSSKSSLKDFVDDLRTANKNYSNTTTVSGADRIETAVEISNKYYNSTDADAVDATEVDNVVLVGSNAIVDGLVASPLAADKKAPLLLTSKDKLDYSVKTEIKRVMDLSIKDGVNTSKKVYIVGGTNSVSKAVEDELKDMGVKVTRLSGDDRYATSLAIADEVEINDDKAYVVGGTGLADAMSIAPVASNLTLTGNATPIVVVDGKADKLSDAAEDFLGDAKVDIIGGLNSVSKAIENDIEDATGESPSRVKGDDRQATNAEVIKKYFAKEEKSSSITKLNGVENFFVAKDGSTKEDQLVDALAVAAVAGNAKVDGVSAPAPIILATDSLSSDQSVALSKVQAGSVKSLNQIGGGIATSVINKIKDLLDM